MKIASMKSDVLPNRIRESFRKGQSISKATGETPRRTFHSNGGAKLENYVIIRDVTSHMKRQKVPVKCEKQ